MDYKDTLNLPQTGFKMKANLVNKEPMQLKEWDKIGLYEYIREQRKGAPLFVLHDGPPYANGNIHVGTALNKILKDFIIKYKTLRGFDAPYIPGWDTHGLPIEQKVTSELGPKSKELPKPEIRKLCRKYATKYYKIQRDQFKRLGVRGDWYNPYLTFDPKYEASVLKILSKLVKQNQIYRKLKPIYWCTHCETALAEAEVEYHDHESYSVYVKFRDTVDPGLFYIIWTTTPWTLPANVAIALNPDFDYCEVEVNGERYLIAKELVENTMKEFGIDDYHITATRKGNEYEGRKALHPFMHRESLIVLADYVELDAGTGCVHTAPGHGEDDYQTGLRYNLPVLSPVNDDGTFTAQAGKYQGLHVFKANPVIVEDLKNSGHLLAEGRIKHSYPHCWRCKKPIIFRATEQWFVDIDANNLREKALNEIKKTDWHPAWGENRITAMVQDRPDWCISRQRSWGIPIPAFKCADCGEVILKSNLIDHFASIVEEKGTDVWFHYDVERLLPEGYNCPKCGSKNLKKLEDILDVWIDSGASFEAVVKNREELRFPSDVYIEGSDQHRGWFQSSLLLSVAAEEIAPFKTVITHGFINDENGRKMSKSLGNVIDPQEINEKYGAEILRLWVASSNYQEDIRISMNIIKQQIENYRKIRNTLRYLLGNLSDFHPEDAIPYEEMLELDRWALMKLHQLIKSVTLHYENYEFYKVHMAVMKFIVTDMSAFYLDIIKDRLYVEGKKSLKRRSAQTVLFEILISLAKVLAPILTFTMEEVYGFLPDSVRAYSTIQAEKWPEFKEEYIKPELEKRWDCVISLREDVLKALEIARTNKEIGNSLDAKVIIDLKDPKLKEVINTFKADELADIFIVSQVDFGRADDGFDGDVSKVKVVKAEGEKCERCWKYSKETGANPKYPGTCPRCAGVLSEN
ncbi:isoleucine--tRNA ligase [Kosmotoga arenicorallina S304]|uniref:Isoleucine--tRNA ligase n=1 Tax=Kosmotoga arenicorallina S304 TaxID=1453497 RepID=A0A182C8M6_9BACT|nr:isoleucine--tRNA ligase [Kosmotoga arenicorallina]OAA31903.1 isoleucine--tRNA ligase [Kosmotoga arenicorallina S304]